MKTNKNIDRLFQEKLKDFHASPPASVWEGIQSNIHPKNPKSILPLWLKISGAAAILLLLTLGGINYFDKNPNEIIITNDIENNPTNENGILNPVLNNLEENNSIVTDATQEKQLQLNTSIENNNLSEVNTEVRNNSNINNTIEIENNKRSINSNETIDNKLLKLNKKEENNNSQVANELTNSNRFLNNKISNTYSENIIATNNDTKNQNVVKTNKPNNTLNTSESVVLNNNKLESIFNNSVVGNKTEIIQNKIEKFGENISANNNIDSIQKNLLNSQEEVASVPNKYDELLKEDLTEENEGEDEKDTKKWSVASTVAPIYYNSFNTKGSPLDLQFKDSPKTGSKSVAYGVKVGYKLNDKLTLQAGVSKIDVGYKIGNVFINPTQQYQVRLKNINYANTNTAAILNVNAKKKLDDSFIETSAITGFTGELNQSFGYIEIPLELKYSISNTSKKLGVNLIGGVSTLLLNKNDVFITTSEFSSSLGEANNLNKVNFSGNIGVDVDYKINKRIYINVAPMLKIHTKTFSNSDSNFEPYLFGVYTGINYKF